MIGVPGLSGCGGDLLAWPDARFVQLAWSTNDIRRAMPLLETWLGVSDFVMVSDRRLMVATPAGQRLLRQNLAFGRSGAASIELVEPIGDDGGFWSQGFSTGSFALRQHHVSVEIEGERVQWEAFRQQAMRQGPFPVEGAFRQTRFLFVDLRPLLGCYLEAMWSDPDPAAGAQPPRSTSITPSTTRDR